MRFRPCIDIHNGKVKQIVGGSLRDEQDAAKENFVAQQDAGWYARLYERDGLKGGHVILLNPESSDYYRQTLEQALQALRVCPGLLQAGGGIRPDNAHIFLDAGASHVIVTSYVFKDGRLHEDHLRRMVEAVGPEHLVLDLSCARRGDEYVIMTDRWQKMTDVVLSVDILDELAESCSEFLVHAVDVEGKASGIEQDLARLLGSWHRIPITYAGGIGSYADIELLRECSAGTMDFTIGSALDLFGGNIAYDKVKTFR